MSQPPQRLPMGKPSPAPKPGPAPGVRPGGPGAPGPAPRGPTGSPPPKKGDGGRTVLMVLLAVFGGIALIIVLLCGGAIYVVYSGARGVAKNVDNARQEVQRQQQRARQNQPPPPPINFPANFPGHLPPSARPIESVDGAVDALADYNFSRRQQAMNYLAEHPVDAARQGEVVAKVLPLLADRQRGGEAKSVLEKWSAGDGASAVAPELLKSMNDRDALLRQTVRDLLTKLEIDDKTLAAQCVADLRSGDVERQREAARWLAAHVVIDEDLSPQVSAALVPLMNTRDVRGDVSAALAVWATADTVPGLVQAAATAHAAQDRLAERDIVVLLTKLNDARALPAYAAFFDTSYDRAAAKNAFAGVGAGAAKTVLPFVNHRDISVRQIARELLTEWEVEPAHVLRQTAIDLQSGDLDRQRESIRALSAVEEPDAEIQSDVAASLITLVDNERLRYDALRALKKWAGHDNVPKLLELLNHENSSVASEAKQILVALQDPRAVEPLAEGIGGEDFFKRTEATRAMRALGPVAETAVWPHVTNPNWMIAKNAVEVLGDIGTKKSIPILEAAKTHQQTFVRSAAEDAIKKVNDADRTVGPMPGVAAAETPAGDGTRQMRTWIDASGKSKIEAIYVEFSLGKVRLRTRTGRSLSLGLDQLSAEDRKYVMEQVQRGP